MNESADPVLASAATGLGLKLGAAAGAGVLGALVMAMVDPPRTRRELFVQATVAAIGSMIFGPVAVKALSKEFDWYSLANLAGVDYIQMVMPVYFLTGAMSWGVFGALAKLRAIVRTRGAEAVADKVLGTRDGT